MIRVCGGKYKRTVLKTLEGDSTRPTKDMVREALFSALNCYSDAIFLDLFAGSGAIGIEALSRGVKKVIFNDNNKKAVAIIKDNLAKIKEEQPVYHLDWQDCLNRIDKIDYAYLDPPYKFTAYDEMLFSLSDKVTENGQVVVEVNKDTFLKERYQDLCLFKEKRYGIARLLFYRK